MCILRIGGTFKTLLGLPRNLALSFKSRSSARGHEMYLLLCLNSMRDSQTLWKLLTFKDQSAFNYTNKLCRPICLLEKHCWHCF